MVRSTVVVNKKGSAQLIDGQRKHLEGTEPGKVRKYVITFRPGPGVGVGVKLVEDVAGCLVIPAAKQEDGPPPDEHTRDISMLIHLVKISPLKGIGASMEYTF